MIHQLHIWPKYFEAVASGIMRFAIGWDYCNFSESDVLELWEFNACPECGGTKRIRVDNGDSEDCPCTPVSSPGAFVIPRKSTAVYSGGYCTGRVVRVRVTYVLYCADIGLQSGYVILSVELPEPAPLEPANRSLVLTTGMNEEYFGRFPDDPAWVRRAADTRPGIAAVYLAEDYEAGVRRPIAWRDEAGRWRPEEFGR